MTQQAMADTLDISLRRMQQLESGSANISIGLLGDIADQLDTKPGLLLRKAKLDIPGPGRPRS